MGRETSRQLRSRLSAHADRKYISDSARIMVGRRKRCVAKSHLIKWYYARSVTKLLDGVIKAIAFFAFPRLPIARATRSPCALRAELLPASAQHTPQAVHQAAMNR